MIYTKMTRGELEKIYEKADMTLPFQMIFNLWDVEEYIPFEIVKIILHPQKSSEKYILYTSRKGLECLENAFKEALRKEYLNK